GVRRLDAGGKDGLVGNEDAGEVVADLANGIAAIRGLAARGLALADLVGELGGAVEETLGAERRALKRPRELLQLPRQRVGLRQYVEAVGAEEPCLDRVKAFGRVRPGIDRLVELGKELVGDGLDGFPAAAG